jgi:hypothetical protein|nr:MAG TPA: hypothetical protein [Caudoviricetes sp.]
MKEFNLDAALNGEPVKLRSGHKAIILNDARNYFKNTRPNEEVLIGFVSDIDNQDKLLYHGAWTSDGSWISNFVDEFDIIGMWEEPKISIEDLPKPFKPDIGDEFFYLSVGTVQYCSFYSDINADLMRNGQCFRTREDAQKWLDFMKSMM